MSRKLKDDKEMAGYAAAVGAATYLQLQVEVKKSEIEPEIHEAVLLLVFMLMTEKLSLKWKAAELKEFRRVAHAAVPLLDQYLSRPFS